MFFLINMFYKYYYDADPISRVISRGLRRGSN